MRNKKEQQRMDALEKAGVFTNQTKHSGDYFGPFNCFVCGRKNKMFTFYQNPAKAFCNVASCEAHKDNGGINVDNYFDLNFDFEKEYKDKPDEICPAYLQSRGLDKTLNGLDARHWKDIRGTGLGGVSFPLSENSAGKKIYMARFYKTPESGGKNHFTGSINGCIFKHPKANHDYNKPILLTEGALDCLSLEEMGQQSLAVVSTNQNPEAIKHHIDPYNNIVLCFDWDEAGIRYTKKSLKVFPNAEVMLMDKEKGDWNDFLCSGPLSKVTANFKANRQRYLNNGKLAMAKSAYEYGHIWHELFNKSGVFTFNGATWFSEILTRGKDEPTARVERIGLFCIEVLAFIDVADTSSNKNYHYKLEITPTGGKPIICVATHRDLSTVRDFNAFLLKTCMCAFTGKNNAMIELMVTITTAKAPVARRAELLGLDHQSRWWISKQWAVDNTGKLHQPDQNGIFKTRTREMLTPAEEADSSTIIHPAFKPTSSLKQIYNLLAEAYPVFGPLSFAWVAGAIFVNEIKAKLRFYPYLSIWGASDIGKTSFVEQLQLLQGWDSEGRDLSNSSSDVGQSRELYQASGMFRAFLEVTPETEKKLHSFINVLSAYNLGGGAVKGVKSNDNKTKESNLYCALLFCQNVEIWRNKQEKTRNISLHFEEENLTPQTLAAYEKLLAISKEDKAAVMVEILKHRQSFEASFQERFKIALADLESIKPGRVKNNFALIHGIHTWLQDTFNLNTEIFQPLEELAIAKEYSSREMEDNAASHFFEVLQGTPGPDVKKYWVEITDPKKSNCGVIYLSIESLRDEAIEKGKTPPKTSDIKRDLKLHPSYLGHGQNYNFYTSTNEFGQKTYARRKAWRLDAAKFHDIEGIRIGEEIKLHGSI